MFGQNDVIAVFICCCLDLQPVSLAHAWAGGGGRVGVGAGRKKTEHDFDQWQSWNQESLLRKEADKIIIMIIILVNHYGCK